MRVLPDTNVFISALMFPNSKPAAVLLRIGSEHQMVLSPAEFIDLPEV